MMTIIKLLYLKYYYLILLSEFFLNVFIYPSYNLKFQTNDQLFTVFIQSILAMQPGTSNDNAMISTDKIRYMPPTGYTLALLYVWTISKT